MDSTNSATKSDLRLLGQSLEKLLENEGNDEVITILTELAKFEVNFDLLKETRVGILVTKCKKKFQDNITIATQCSELIDAWKKVAESSKKSVGTSISSSTSQTTVSVVKAAVKEGVLETFTSSQSIDSTSSLVPTSTESEAASEASPRDTGASDEEFNSLCESLPANRKKVIELFTNILVVGLTTSQASVAKFLAFSIESSLNNTFKDNESYMAKFRSLSSNLKKNDRLRHEIVIGTCPTEVLVHLSPTDLATDELKQEREVALQDSTNARRSDFYQVKRAEIQRSVGIDPNAGGAFVCKKCKGDKTTYYQMQTRSSDEPMTVFVTCLSCGTKWRC